jgi:primary-amine oxidase
MRPRPIRFLAAVLTVAYLLTRPTGCPAEDKKRTPVQSSIHPLDPLNKEELASAVAVLKESGKVADTSRFVLIHLHEPPKSEVLAYRPGKVVPRQAFAVLYDWATNTTSEAIVDLAGKKLVSWQNVPGAQPPLLPEDDHQRTAEIVRADHRWREAMKKRGIKDLDRVVILGYPIGAYTPEAEDGARRAFAVMYSRERGSVEDLIVLVDLTKKKVFQFEDRGDKHPGVKLDEFGALGAHEAGGPARRPSKNPLPKQRFEVRSHEVRWGHWRFRFSMHPRTGLVLHTVGYEDEGRLRPVLYRASLSEMVVPYGDPNWVLWSPFDAGEYGMGVYAKTALNPGTDAPEDAAFFGAVLHDRKGTPVEVPRAVALYERDGGVLWRHGRSARRARQLVLSSFVQVDEYDYGFNWVFHPDGTLEMELLLTGRMNVKPVARKEDDEAHDGKTAFGHLVAPRVEAPNHQHFFNFRLDLDVDGPGNSVRELNTEALPEGPDNPHGNAFAMKETPLRREQEAQRGMNLATGRKWKIINTCIKNALGQPTGYVLVPGENSLPHAAAKSFARRHAGFINAHLWVTPYQPEEMYAAGAYVNGARPGEGLPKWTRANRSIEDEDLVVWYTLGVTHVPRPEEWPLMPVHRAGFQLMPAGFFSRNPALAAPKAN